MSHAYFYFTPRFLRKISSFALVVCEVCDAHACNAYAQYLRVFKKYADVFNIFTLQGRKVYVCSPGYD